MELDKRQVLRQLTIITVAGAKVRAYIEQIEEEKKGRKAATPPVAALNSDDDPDPWWDVLKPWLAKPTPEGEEPMELRSIGQGVRQRAYMPEMLRHALNFRERDWTTAHSRRVSVILQRHGWIVKREPRGVDGGPHRPEFWISPMNIEYPAV